MEPIEPSVDLAGDSVPDPRVRSVLERIEVAEQELRVAEEARRSREEELVRLAEEVERETGAALAVATAERAELQERMRGIEERIAALEATRARFGTKPSGSVTGASEPSGAPAVSSNLTLPDVGTTTRSIPTRLGDWDNGSDGSSAPSDASADAEGTQSSADAGSESEQSGAYEDGWYEVLKQADA